MRICSSLILLTSVIHFCIFIEPVVGMSRKLVGNSLQKREVETRTFLADILGLSTLKLITYLFLPLFFIIPIMLFFSALLLIPIPVLTSPVAGIAAAVGRRYSAEDGVEQLFHELLKSGECIERISCEVGRTITNVDVRAIVDQMLNDLAPFLKDKWKGTIHGYVLGSNGRLSPVNNCGKYTCKVGNAEAVDDWNF